MTAIFPIWKRDTRELIATSTSTVSAPLPLASISKALDPSFAGRELDESFFRESPPHADPCGENGEFHTFVFDGPIFQSPFPFEREGGQPDGFIFCDLLPQLEEATNDAQIPQKETLLYATLLALA